MNNAKAALEVSTEYGVKAQNVGLFDKKKNPTNKEWRYKRTSQLISRLLRNIGNPKV